MISRLWALQRKRGRARRRVSKGEGGEGKEGGREEGE
jgi:hypothetical protein